MHSLNAPAFENCGKYGDVTIQKVFQYLQLLQKRCNRVGNGEKRNVSAIFDIMFQLYYYWIF